VCERIVYLDGCLPWKVCPETVQPRLLRRVAEIHGIPQYKVWSNEAAAKTYQSLLRKTLFIELSDGGRIESLFHKGGHG